MKYNSFNVYMRPKLSKFTRLLTVYWDMERKIFAELTQAWEKIGITKFSVESYDFGAEILYLRIWRRTRPEV